MQILSVLAMSALALASSPGSGVSRRAEPAALLRPDAKDLIPDQYIVKMKPGASPLSMTQSKGARHTFTSPGFQGFAASLDAEQLDAVRFHPDVDYVEQDYKVSLFDTVTQTGAPWGISRISQTEPGISDYVYDDSAGEGTCIYVIDTGIKVDHPDFEGRAFWLENFIDDNDADGAGHGTWVAGLAGSATYGVAKKTTLFALKVFDDSGATDGSAIVAAMDFVASDAPSRGDDCPAGTVANLSLGGGYSQTSNDAADNMVNSGVFVAVAAGNSNVDAGETSPASAPLVCTVGATDSEDVRAEFSSYGSVLDIWAPGVDLESTSYDGTVTSASGTSGSSPIVAGLGAYLLTLEGNPGAEAVCDRIKELALKDVLSDIPEGSVNYLAFNGITSNSTTVLH